MPAYGNSLSQAQSLMTQLKQEASQTYNEISHEKAKASALQSSMVQTRSALVNVQNAIQTTHQQAASTLVSIHALDVHIHVNEMKLDGAKQGLEGQLRAMYEGGPTQYLNVLFGARSFQDFLSRLTLLEMVAARQQSLIQTLHQAQAAIVGQRHAQTQQFANLQRKNSELQTFEGAQRILQRQNTVMLAQVNATVQADSRRNVVLESQIRLTQAQIQQIEAETQKAEALMQNASYVQQQRAGLAQVAAGPIINYAETLMGTPYVWGGTSPGGFDCSGFVQYVFGHFGINLNRTSEDQFAEGVPISASDLQPGDLVFFSTYAPGASHVGIYMGNGMMIDAADAGVSVDNVFSSYWGSKYIGARQVTK